MMVARWHNWHIHQNVIQQLFAITTHGSRDNVTVTYFLLSVTQLFYLQYFLFSLIDIYIELINC